MQIANLGLQIENADPRFKREGSKTAKRRKFLPQGHRGHGEDRDCRNRTREIRYVVCHERRAGSRRWPWRSTMKLRPRASDPGASLETKVGMGSDVSIGDCADHADFLEGRTGAADLVTGKSPAAVEPAGDLWPWLALRLHFDLDHVDGESKAGTVAVHRFLNDVGFGRILFDGAGGGRVQFGFQLHKGFEGDFFEFRFRVRGGFQRGGGLGLRSWCAVDLHSILSFVEGGSRIFRPTGAVFRRPRRSLVWGPLIHFRAAS